jgi:hypothetical protein
VNTAVLQLTSLSTTGSLTAASLVATGAMTAGSGLVTLPALTSTGDLSAAGQVYAAGYPVMTTIKSRLTAAEATTSGASWQTLIPSFTLPANTLSATGPAIVLEAGIRRRSGTGGMLLRVRLGASATIPATAAAMTVSPQRVSVVLGMRSTANTFYCFISAGNTGGYLEWTDATINTASALTLTLEGNPATGSDLFGVEYSYLGLVPSN